jgi:hypothetical protein
MDHEACKIKTPRSQGTQSQQNFFSDVHNICVHWWHNTCALHIDIKWYEVISNCFFFFFDDRIFWKLLTEVPHTYSWKNLFYRLKIHINASVY